MPLPKHETQSSSLSTEWSPSSTAQACHPSTVRQRQGVTGSGRNPASCGHGGQWYSRTPHVLLGPHAYTTPTATRQIHVTAPHMPRERSHARITKS